MSNFTAALAAILYGLVCLTQASERGMSLRSTAVEIDDPKAGRGEIKIKTHDEPQKPKSD
jgi:hypothetical protein